MAIFVQKAFTPQGFWQKYELPPPLDFETCAFMLINKIQGAHKSKIFSQYLVTQYKQFQKE